MNLKALGSFLAGLLVLALPAATVLAQSASDACSLLTQAQVSAAVGAQVSAGVHMTPTFKATCNWSAPGKIVTLMTEGVDAFNAGKNPLSPIMQVVPAPGIGDDAYYIVSGGAMVALITRKGSNAFKTSVYSKLPVATLESMESKLAQQVAGEL
jgi:hypothetical protein